MNTSATRSARARTQTAVTRALHVSAVTLLLASAACFDAAAPTGPGAKALDVVSRIDCVGSTVARSVSCTPAGAASLLLEDPQSGARFSAPAPLRDVILGNQGGYVKLTSSNIVVAGGVFAFDVTLQNKIPQAIGTTNGFSAAAAGSKVFFSAGPLTTSGTGSVDFVNGGGFFYDGTGTFTNSGQPYFQYVAILNTGAVSSAKTWRIRFDPGVLTFSFSVFVSTPVKFPNGYIDGNPSVLTMNPSETASLGGTVRSAVGNVVGGTITYASDDPTIASVAASGIVTAGPSRGVAYMSLTSGAIPNFLSTAVNVCPSTPTITSGVAVPGVIDVNDCYSSFAGNSRPDPTFLSDMYRITLTAGQQIAITMTTDGTFDPALTLAGPQGIVEATAVNVGSTATIPAGAAVQQSGVYTVEAGQSADFATASSAPGYTGNYTITVTVTP